MKDLLSIVVPVYNVEKFLERAVYSIINQTYKNLEIILVDDGSKDMSGILCDELAKKDNRIKVIHQENAGLSAARNVGIKNATGKYIGFVDSDDLIADNMYEVLYNGLIENNGQISICNYVPFSIGTPLFSGSYKTEVLSTDEALKELLIDKKIRSFAWNKLYDRELFEHVDFPVGKKYEDIATTYRLFLGTNKIIYIDANLYGYFIRQGSITGNYNIESALDLMEMVEYRYNYLLKKKENLLDYINMNKVNSVTRYFIDIAKSGKLSVLKNKNFMKKINAELSIAKSINGKTIKKINTGKQNFLNMLLFINPYIFCYTMMALCKMRNSMSKFLQANMFKFNFFIDRPDLYLNSHKNSQMIIVTGISGAGKSYTAMQLSEKYNYPILSFDNLFNYEETREVSEFERNMITNFRKKRLEFCKDKKIVENPKTCNAFFDFVLDEIKKNNQKIIFDGAYFLVKVDFDKFKEQRIILKRTAFFKALHRRKIRGIKLYKKSNSNVFKNIKYFLSLEKFVLLNEKQWYNDQKSFLKKCKDYFSNL